jgi:nucleotide-binding universal stress UspA family protein
MVGFKKILCPVDFFPASLKAYDYALKLAANYDSTIHVLHVVAPLIPTAYGAPVNVADLTTALISESKRQLKKLKTHADKAGVPVQTEVRTGDIDLEIRRAIRTKKAELVVMGTHGRHGFERWVMGSVVERVMRHCPVPLLAIGAAKKERTAPPAIRNIMVTTDFSAGTAEALAYAFSIAQECQSKITLLHVISDLTMVDVDTKLRDPLVEGVRKKLEDLVPDEARAWCEVKTRVETGTPYRRILKILNEEKVGLLVMNVHGKGMLDRALVGSTAERVVRAAECPVMLIPPMGAEKKKKARRAGQKAA